VLNTILFNLEDERNDEVNKWRRNTSKVAEITFKGKKIGSRFIALISSIPYLKYWIGQRPRTGNSPLIYIDLGSSQTQHPYHFSLNTRILVDDKNLNCLHVQPTLL
jgi:hypothetical protein